MNLQNLDIASVFHFLFETYTGIGCLVAFFLVASVIAAIIMERRTRKRFVDRGERTSSRWEFGDDDADAAGSADASANTDSASDK